MVDRPDQPHNDAVARCDAHRAPGSIVGQYGWLNKHVVRPSTAAVQPVPAMAVYAATKAFVLSFTEVLRQETRGSGARAGPVPGATETGFFAAAAQQPFMTRGRQTPLQVVQTALTAIGTTPTIMSGRMNRLRFLGPPGCCPRRIVPNHVPGRAIAGQ
jgi:NAD(P)-dependent dehydrogenase (short-subunit alcohol dehydrogenase family)